MENIIYGLSNEDYHNKPPYSEYLSSSQLKAYAKSPKFAKFLMDNPQPQTDAMRFGSLFHGLMACLAEENGDWSKGFFKWKDNIATFDPPINSKTGVYYGATTKAYTEAYEQFLADNAGKQVAHVLEADKVGDMANSLVRDCGNTSKQVCKLLKWGKAEVSHFIEYEGCKFKWRPDLERRKIVVDYKTVSTDDLSEKSINSIIANYGYDISAAFYLFMEHEQSGVWKTFYWLFVTKNPPHDAILVDASKWTYELDPTSGVVLPQVGAIKMKRLLDLHIKCKKENNYPGSEIFIPADGFGRRIMLANPPAWEVNNAANIL